MNAAFQFKKHDPVLLLLSLSTHKCFRPEALANAASTDLENAMVQLTNTRDGLDLLVAHGSDEPHMLETLNASFSTVESYKKVKTMTIKLVGSPASAKVFSKCDFIVF